jgi:uncharacterized delta-60 repeat protein
LSYWFRSDFMKNFDGFYSHVLQQKHYILIFVVFVGLCANLTIYAQPFFNAVESSFLKGQKHYTRSMKYHLTQEELPMKTLSSDGNMLLDGGIDGTFNASVTESFGYVNKSIVQPDGKILVVGLFQRVNGVRINCIARFNGDGSSDSTFNVNGGSNAAIRALALQSDGKIIIGGAFTSFGGQSVNRIVRLNSNGTIDNSFSLSTAFNGQINDILILPNSKIMVGGAFSVLSSGLVRLNSNGTLDSGVAIISGSVSSIAIAADGKIAVGGDFSSPRANVARLNSDATLDSAFNPTTGGAGFPVFKVVVQSDGKIIAGGVFSSFNGVTTDGVVRLTDTGSVDTVFNITNDPNVVDLEADGLALQPDGKILVSYFSNSGTLIADMRRFNTDASLDTTFNTNTNNSLTAVDINLLQDGSILAAGYFASLNNQTRLRIAKFDSSGNLDNNFAPQISNSGIVYAITRQPDGKLLIGGDFENVNGIRKSAIARLNEDGTLDTTFTIGAGFFGDIYSIAVQPDGKIIIGGLFSGDSNLFPAYAAARLNSNGSFDVNLNGGNGPNFAFVVYDVGLQSDGKIIIGGQIINQLNSSRVAVVRLNSNGLYDTAFTPAAISNGITRAVLVQPNGKIVIGGTFFSTGGANPRNGILRLNNDGSLDSAFSNSVGTVTSLRTSTDGRVYAGGFSLNRFSSEGVIDATLNIGSGFNSQIRTISVQSNNKILLGGLFTTYNGSPVNRIIRIEENGVVDSTFNVGTGPFGNIFVSSLDSTGKIIIGGQFLDFGNAEKLSIVRLQNSIVRRPPIDFDGDGKTDISVFRPSVGEWYYQRSSNSAVNGAQFGSPTDKPVPADYTGDGKTDIAFFRPSSGEWYILRSEDFSFYAFPFGLSTDIPSPGDFDGDGKADQAVFRPSNGVWYINKSTGGVAIQPFGVNGDRTVVADYDGDGKSDIAIFRPSVGEWYYLRSSDSQVRGAQFGAGSDKTVQGDYTGDGKADFVFFRPSTGNWFVLRSEDFSFFASPFGISTDTPTIGDYDGDGKFDQAVFRPSNGVWYINRSTAGIQIQQFGAGSDLPLPSYYLP